MTTVGFHPLHQIPDDGGQEHPDRPPRADRRGPGVVKADATLEKVEGRRLTFTVTVNDRCGLVAAGRGDPGDRGASRIPRQERQADKTRSPMSATSRPPEVDVVGIDTDDTLWHNESYFAEAQATFVEIVGPWTPTGHRRPRPPRRHRTPQPGAVRVRDQGLHPVHGGDGARGERRGGLRPRPIADSSTWASGPCSPTPSNCSTASPTRSQIRPSAGPTGWC